MTAKSYSFSFNTKAILYGNHEHVAQCSLCFVFQFLEKGMRFTMRDGKHTLGYGVVTELLDKVDIEKLDAERKVVKKTLAKEQRAAEEEQ